MIKTSNISTNLFLAVVCLIAVITNENIFADASDIQSNFEWKAGQRVSGVNGSVYATMAWDPDGDGPKPEMLIMAGFFTVAGNVTANNIVAWDGENWQKLGSGMNQPVQALTVYKGELIAGGGFTVAGGVSAKYIARWDGNAWHPLGSGMNDYVYALAVYNDELIAAAQVWGRVSTNVVVRWDGSNWQPLGGGIMNNRVCALTVYNEELIAAGYFTIADGVSANKLAQWNGSNWQPLDIGVSGGYTTTSVQTLTTYNGCLIAGGNFSKAGDLDAKNIVSWNGSAWQPLGSGVNGSVTSLTIYNNQLIAGDLVAISPGVSGNYIVRWDGNNWQQFGSMNGYIRKLTVYNDQLIAGGDFTATGSLSTSGIALFADSNWQPLSYGNSLNDTVFAFTVYNGQLIAGGWFGNVGGSSIARWDGSTWHPLGSGMNSAVSTLAVYNGELIAGGLFTKAGGEDANYIARWDGSTWHPLGSGMNSAISVLAVYNGELIAGGWFTKAGGVDANYIAQWNGSNWLPLGTGMDFGTDYYDPITITAATIYNGELIVAGGSSSQGGGGKGGGNAGVHSLARWNGQTWQPLGNGNYSNAYVNAFTVYNNKLIAGGGFAKIGGVDANSIAQWDGSNWQSVGGGIKSTVQALTVYKGKLFAGGFFTTADRINVNYIACWDDSIWQPLGSGMNNIVNALTVYNNNLIAGGDFTTAGGTVSTYWARWGPINTPPIACIAGGTQILKAQGAFGAKVTLDGSCSSDVDSTPGTNDDINDFNWYEVDPCNPDNRTLLGKGEIIDCNLTLGKHSIVLEVIDKAGATDSNEITVTVQNTTPPEFNLSVTPNVLWPANHKMVKIAPTWTVSDDCDPSPKVSLVGITCNDKNAANDDIRINNDGSIYLRAEKGRIYTITYKACDESGNCSIKTAGVTIPHDNGKVK